MNSIGDMQNEMYFYGHCNMFEFNNNYVKFSRKIGIQRQLYNYMYMCESIFIVLE